MSFPYNKHTKMSENSPEEKRLQSAAGTITRLRGRRRNALAGVLVVGLIVVASLLLFNHHTILGSNIPLGKAIGVPAGTSAKAHNEVGGLETTLSITPGPYFLSELMAVDITLTNQSPQRITLGGSPAINSCNGAFSVTITGGQEPHYDVPGQNFMMSCPPGMSILETKKSLTLHSYVPLTKSGAVTVTLAVRVATATQGPNGVTNITGVSTLDRHWPTVAILVSPQIPSDRFFSLQAQGSNVLVNAPDAVRPHMVYFYTVNCLHGSGTNDGWDPLKTTVLQEPGCDDSIRHWIYAVSAPGYAIAALEMGF